MSASWFIGPATPISIRAAKSPSKLMHFNLFMHCHKSHEADFCNAGQHHFELDVQCSGISCMHLIAWAGKYFIHYWWNKGNKGQCFISCIVANFLLDVSLDVVVWCESVCYAWDFLTMRNITSHVIWGTSICQHIVYDLPSWSRVVHVKWYSYCAGEFFFTWLCSTNL